MKDRLLVVVRVTLQPLRIDRTAIDPDPKGTIMLGGDLHNSGDLVLLRLLFLVVMEVSWVVTDLLDVRGEARGEAITLLKINHQRRAGLIAEPSQRLHVFVAIHRNSDQVRPRLFQDTNLPEGRVKIRGSCRRHALDGYRIGPADLDATDMDFTGFSLG